MDSSDDDDDDDLLFSPTVCSIWFDDEDEVLQAIAILQQEESCNEERATAGERGRESGSTPGFHRTGMLTSSTTNVFSSEATECRTLPS